MSVPGKPLAFLFWLQQSLLVCPMRVFTPHFDHHGLLSFRTDSEPAYLSIRHAVHYQGMCDAAPREIVCAITGPFQMFRFKKT
jgi:hypothetical protein